jgi:hypothetical protein
MATKYPKKEFQPPDSDKKWSISFYSGLLFFIIASPALFRLVNEITMKFGGVSILTAEGNPNIVGYLLHTLVFILIVRISMEF